MLSLSLRDLWETVPFGCVVARVRRSEVRGRRRAVSAWRVRVRVMGEGSEVWLLLVSLSGVPERRERSCDSAWVRRVERVVVWCEA